MQFRLKKLRNDLIMILDKNKIFEDFFDDINIEDDVKTEEILQSESFTPTSYSYEFVFTNKFAFEWAPVNVNALRKLLYGIFNNTLFCNDTNIELVHREKTLYQFNENTDIKDITEQLNYISNNRDCFYLTMRINFNIKRRVSLYHFIKTNIDIAKWLYFLMYNSGSNHYVESEVNWKLICANIIMTPSCSHCQETVSTDTILLNGKDSSANFKRYLKLYKILYPDYVLTESDLINICKKFNLNDTHYRMFRVSYLDKPMTFEFLRINLKDNISVQASVHIKPLPNFYISYKELCEKIYYVFENDSYTSVQVSIIDKTRREILIDDKADNEIDSVHIGFSQYDNRYILDGISINDLQKLFHQIENTQTMFIVSNITDMTPGEIYKIYPELNFSKSVFGIEDQCKIKVTANSEVIKFKLNKK